MQTPSRFVANHGPVGPLGGRGTSYTQPANPWVRRTVNVGASKLRSPVATTATVSGIANVGCCSGCSGAHRRGE